MWKIPSTLLRGGKEAHNLGQKWFLLAELKDSLPGSGDSHVQPTLVRDKAQFAQVVIPHAGEHNHIGLPSLVAVHRRHDHLWHMLRSRSHVNCAHRRGGGKVVSDLDRIQDQRRVGR